MPYEVLLDDAKREFPEYEFVARLTPSEQKAAFHVRDSDGRDLCLKLISPNYSIDRMNREIAALQAITQANVVRLEEYTYSSKPGSQRHYMIEEFIEGEDLAARLRNGMPWPRGEVSDIFAQLCDGLEALRAANVVHRDLKPSNIRIRPNGCPVIIDFGLARLLSLPDLTRTEQGAAIGTPLYFAPEQFDGTKYDIDHRTDLFALGVLSYQALIGGHPFASGNCSYSQLRDAVCEGEGHFASPGFLAIPEKWQIVLRWLLAKIRAQRPSSAAQVAVVLRKLRQI